MSRYSLEPTKADRDLIAAARECGVTVSQAQLGRWRDKGLIAAPIQRSAGRGPGRPSETYPDGTLERVLAIARLLETKPRVTLGDVSIWLFLFGDNAFLQPARTTFTQDVAQMQDALAKMPLGSRTLGFTKKMLGGLSRTNLYAMIMSTHGSRKLRADSAAYRTALIMVDMLAGRDPDPLALDEFAGALELGDSKDRRTFRSLMTDVQPSRFSHHLRDLSDDELTAARDAGIKVVEYLMYVIPGGSGETWQQRAWGLRKLLRIHAAAAMFGVIQIARSQRLLGYFYERLDEEIHAIRNGPERVRETGSLES